MSEANTIIGKSILIQGTIEGDEDLTVQGRVEGAIRIEKTLVVDPQGVVKAEVQAEQAVISGIMLGNVTARDSVELTGSGKMVGDIRAPRVSIAEGAQFRGKVDMGGGESLRSAVPIKRSLSRPSSPPLSKPISPRPAIPAVSAPVAEPKPSDGSSSGAGSLPSGFVPVKSLIVPSKKKIIIKKKP